MSTDTPTYATLADMRDRALIAERELATVTEQRDQWKEKYIQQNKDLGHELRDPNGTIWSECKRLQTELAAVTEQRDRLVEALEIAANRFRYPEFGCNWENVSKEIESALQSLTPNAEL